MQNVRKIALSRSLWLLGPVLCFSQAQSALAQEKEWWFEVEVILFKRDQDPNQLAERFPQQLSHPDVTFARDLLSAHLAPDVSQLESGLPLCTPSSELSGSIFPVPRITDPLLSDPDVGVDELGVSVMSFDESRPEPAIPMFDDTLSYSLNWPGAISSGATLKDSPATSALLTPDGFLSTTILSFELFHLPKLIEEKQRNSDEQLALDIQNDAGEGLQSLRETLANINHEQEGPEESTEKDLFALAMLATPLPEIVMPKRLDCVFAEERFSGFTLDVNSAQGFEVKPVNYQVPTTIDGIEWVYSDTPYLIKAESLQMSDLARDIRRQRDVSQLLHIGWRQEVLFGQEKAWNIRLFAGENYADRFAKNGEQLPVNIQDSTLPYGNVDLAMQGSEDMPPLSVVTDDNNSDGLPEISTENANSLGEDETDLIQRILLALEGESHQTVLHEVEPQTQERVAELWELDGLFKVFLRYINRTPYLHIDSTLDFRAPVMVDSSQPEMTSDIESNSDTIGTVNNEPKLRLQSFPFSQLRRVISKQVHYFDHPMFGMVVQIRRYHRPLPPEPEQADNLEAHTR